MSSVLQRPVSHRPRSADVLKLDLVLEPDLIVERTDIHFRSIAPGRVRISVNVTNVGFARSEPTTMHLQAAPLGAFVPWSDLTSLVVPPIEPGRSVEVTADVAAPPVESLGEFSRVPPRRLLTAIGGEDGPHRQTPEAPPKHAQPKHASPRKGQPRHKQPTHQQAATSWWQLLTRFFGRKKPVQTSITLPPDPHDLLARPNIHWAGNINVLIGRTAVERHLAQALRIYPGRTNLGLFFVGDRRDDYQFELTGSGANWDAQLFECNQFMNFASAINCGQPIERSKWIRLDGRHIILLALCPPAACQAGAVNVHIRQRTTGRDAIVEFSLDPNAAGAGCYTV